jgi:hypothetical protein
MNNKLTSRLVLQVAQENMVKRAPQVIAIDMQDFEGAIRSVQQHAEVRVSPLAQGDQLAVDDAHHSGQVCHRLGDGRTAARPREQRSMIALSSGGHKLLSAMLCDTIAQTPPVTTEAIEAL